MKRPIKKLIAMLAAQVMIWGIFAVASGSLTFGHHWEVGVLYGIIALFAMPAVYDTFEY